MHYLYLFYVLQQATENDNWSLLEEAKTLLVPFVVSLINLVIPLFYSLFNKFEHYSTHRKQIYALLIRWNKTIYVYKYVYKYVYVYV